jgi:hypothetical protein
MNKPCEYRLVIEFEKSQDGEVQCVTTACTISDRAPQKSTTNWSPQGSQRLSPKGSLPLENPTLQCVFAQARNWVFKEPAEYDHPLARLFSGLEALARRRLELQSVMMGIRMV